MTMVVFDELPVGAGTSKVSINSRNVLYVRDNGEKGSTLFLVDENIIRTTEPFDDVVAKLQPIHFSDEWTKPPAAA